MDLSVNLKKRNTILWIIHFIICSIIAVRFSSELIVECFTATNYSCYDTPIVFIMIVFAYFPVLVSGILLYKLMDKYVIISIISLSISLLSWFVVLFFYLVINR